MPKLFEDYARTIIGNLDAPEPDDFDGGENEEGWPWPDLDESFAISPLDEEGDEVSFDDRDDAPFSGEDRADIIRGVDGDGQFPGRGIDFFAFYKSLHFEEMSPFQGKWGIFVFDFGIKYLRDRIFDHYRGKFLKSECDQLAKDLLIRHEQFHFRFDAWAISHEAVTNIPYYENYMRQIYQPLAPSIQVVEESLANRYAYQWNRLKKIKGFMKQFMRRQPGAYKLFDDKGVDYDEYRGHLAGEVFKGRPYLSSIPATLKIPGAPLVQLSGLPRGGGNPLMEHAPYIGFGDLKKLPDSDCPTYRIRARGLSIPSQVLPSFNLPAHREAQRFIENYLSAKPAGRINGHDAFKIDNGETIKFPNSHGQDRLLKHEYENIVGKAGVTMGQYSRERTRTRQWKKHCPRAKPLPPRV